MLACLPPPERPRPRTLAVAVSGGPDSTALAALLHAWGAANGVRVVAMTVDHALRPESAHEAAHVHARMHALGLEHTCVRLVWDAHGGVPRMSKLQVAARDLRYEALSRMCAARGIAHVCTAHTLDDSIETVLQRLTRASGLHGLAGMRPVMHLQNGITVLRPLLGVPKQRLIATCAARRLPYVDDPSNRNAQFDRVRMRVALAEMVKPRDGSEAPLFTRAELAQLVHDFQATDDDIMRAVVHTLKRSVNIKSFHGFAVLDVAHLAAMLHPKSSGSVVAHAAVSRIVSVVGGRAAPPNTSSVAAVTQHIVRVAEMMSITPSRRNQVMGAGGWPSIELAQCKVHVASLPAAAGAQAPSGTPPSGKPRLLPQLVISRGALQPHEIRNTDDRVTLLRADAATLWDRRFHLTLRGASAQDIFFATRMTVNEWRHLCFRYPELERRVPAHAWQRIGLPVVCRTPRDSALARSSARLTARDALSEAIAAAPGGVATSPAGHQDVGAEWDTWWTPTPRDTGAPVPRFGNDVHAGIVDAVLAVPHARMTLEPGITLGVEALTGRMLFA